jgi:hypothetical protein
MKDLRLAQKGKSNERITEPTTVRDLAIIFKALEHAREQSRRSRNSPMKSVTPSTILAVDESQNN